MFVFSSCLAFRTGIPISFLFLYEYSALNLEWTLYMSWYKNFTDCNKPERKNSPYLSSMKLKLFYICVTVYNSVKNEMLLFSWDIRRKHQSNTNWRFEKWLKSILQIDTTRYLKLTTAILSRKCINNTLNIFGLKLFIKIK